MSGEKENRQSEDGQAAEQNKEERWEIDLEYSRNSEMLQGETADQVMICANSLRDPVCFKAKLKESLLVRECLAALYEVVSGDFSYKPKDRSAYLAYQAMKKQHATAAVWEARQAYFDWLERNDPDAWLILDPVISVFPDRLTFEVFSKDEGAYAILSLDNEAFIIEGETLCGTTNIDFSKEFITAIERIRTYRETRLEIFSGSVSSETIETDISHKVIKKKIKLPTSWIRGFLQVQSAGLMSRSHFELKPMDFYNLLRHLRLNKDQKTGGRALRVELVPGERPRLVLEPWNTVLESSGGVYTGRRPEIVRLWGRRRLKVLARLLPLAQSIDIHIIGSGMPAYFVVKAGPAVFTLALTGFSAANWSRNLVFDLLLPRPEKASPALQEVLDYLKKARSAGIPELEKELNQGTAAGSKHSLPSGSEHSERPVRSRGEIIAAVQEGCQQGILIYDLESCRLRPLLDEPLPQELLRFRNKDERTAHDLLAQKGAVSLESEEPINEVGVEVTGKVKADQKEYRPLLRLSHEGGLLKAECTCPFFRKHQLKEGPCAHLIALNLHFGEIEMQRKANPDRKRVRLETRVYSMRHEDGRETFYRLTLNDRHFTKRWTKPGAKEKKHAMLYNSAEAARKAYFEEVDTLEARGFIDVRS